jgi:hypothetical protein
MDLTLFMLTLSLLAAVIVIPICVCRSVNARTEARKVETMASLGYVQKIQVVREPGLRDNEDPGAHAFVWVPKDSA